MAKFSDAITWQKAYDDKYISANTPIRNNQPNQESEEEKLKRVANYFQNIVSNASNIDYQAKLAQERKSMFESTDNPTPQEVEQDHPVASVLNYLPTNPLFTQNWANAISTWMGNKPAPPTWNPGYDKLWFETKTKKVNEAMQYKSIAAIDPEKRTPEQTDQINQYVAGALKRGEYKTAKTILQAMPENYEKLSPEKKTEVLENSTAEEQRYLKWKKSQAEKIKLGEEKRREKQNMFTNLSETTEGTDWFSKLKKDALGSIGNIVSAIDTPLYESSMKIDKSVQNIGSGNDVGKNIVHALSGMMDFTLSTLMMPLNAAVGSSKGSHVDAQFNLANNALMEIMALPGKGAALVMKKFGVEDKELLHSIESIGNGAAIFLVPAYKGLKNRAVARLQEATLKKVTEAKAVADLELQKEMKSAIDPQGKLPTQDPNVLGKNIIDKLEPADAVKAKDQPTTLKELELRRDQLEKEATAIYEDKSLSTAEEQMAVAKKAEEMGVDLKKDYGRQVLQELDDVKKKIEIEMEEAEVAKAKQAEPITSGVTKEEIGKKKVDEEFADEYDPMTDDAPPVTKEKKPIEEEPTGSPYDDYEPTPAEKAQLEKQQTPMPTDKLAIREQALTKTEKPRTQKTDEVLELQAEEIPRETKQSESYVEFERQKALAEATPTEKVRMEEAIKEPVMNIPLEALKDDIVSKSEAPIMMEVSKVEVHPDMQFKGRPDEKGVTKEGRLTGVEYSKEKAGMYLFWEDPATGKIYVVDGHHRLELAKEKGVKTIPGYKINAETLSEARAKGAWNNMANGKGSAVDVARVLKEFEYGLDDLAKEGVSAKEGTAVKRGADLSKLNNDLLDKVERSDIYDKTKEIVSDEMMPEKYGVIIGREAPIPLELSTKHAAKKMTEAEAMEYERLSNIQKTTFDFLKENPDTTPTVLTEILKEKMGTKQVRAEAGPQSGMFAENTLKYEKERAELRADFDKRMGTDISLAATAKNKRKAAGLEERGLGDLDVGKGQAEFERLSGQKETWDKLKYSELSEITKNYAKELSEAKNATERKAIKDRHNADLEAKIQSLNERREGKANELNLANESEGLRGQSGAAVQEAAARPLRQVKEIPIEPAKTEALNKGDRYFGPEGELWEVIQKHDDGSITAKDGLDMFGNQIYQKFSGDIQLKGLNAKETAFSGGTAAKSLDVVSAKVAEREAMLRAEQSGKSAANLTKEELELYKKNDAAAMNKVTFKQKLIHLLESTKYFTQKFPALDYNLKDNAYASNVLRNMQSASEKGFNYAREAFYFVDKHLEKVKNGKEVFGLRAQMNTVLHDIKSGIYDIYEGKGKNKQKVGELPLPEGWTREFVEKEANRLNEMVKADKNLSLADANFRDYYEGALEGAVEHGVLPKEVLTNPSYFHKMVIEYIPFDRWNREGVFRTGSDKAKSRQGSAESFNSNFHLSMATVLRDIVRDTHLMVEYKNLLKETDIRPQLAKEAAKKGFTEFEDYLAYLRQEGIKEVNGIKLDDYVQYDPRPLTDTYRVATPAAKWMQRKIGVDVPTIKATERAYIHKNIATELNRANFTDADILNKGFRTLDKAWKVNVLFNPIRFAKYTMRNAYSDFSRVVMTYPEIFKEVKGSFNDLKQYKNQKLSSVELREAMDNSVLDSGMSEREFTRTLKMIAENDMEIMLDPSKRGTLAQYNVFKKYGKNVVEMNKFRENVMRLASYKYFKKQLAEGKELYGMSNHKVIDAIPKEDIVRRSAQLARDLMIDYGNSSAFANRVARGVSPFYRWMEGNPKGIINQIRNFAYEEGGWKGKNVARFTAGSAAKLGLKLVKYTALANATYGLVHIWNNIMFPEVSIKLNFSDARRGDLIIGQKDDGTLITLPLESATQDMMSWLGLGDWMSDLQDFITGRKSTQDVLTKIKEAPFKKALQSVLPIPKMIAESMAGKQYYDPFVPTPIIDNSRYWAKAAQLEPLYKAVMSMAGEPLPERKAKIGGLELSRQQSFWYNTIGSMLWNETNVDELAYNIIRSKGYQYQLDVKGKEAPSSSKDAMGLALYYYKQAIKYGDKEAATHYKKTYVDLAKASGKDYVKGLNSSLKNTDPLHMIAKENRADFIQRLTPYERELYKTAKKWHEETYK